MKFRHSIRFKLLLVSLTLLSIPWAGYRFVVETEHFLRDAQQQNLQANAQAIAALFASQTELSDVRLPNQAFHQRDLYLTPWDRPPVIDGYADEWRQYAAAFSTYHLPDNSLSARIALGEHAQSVYLLLEVRDPSRNYAPEADSLELSIADGEQLQRWRIAPRAPGWVMAERQVGQQFQTLPQVRGEWQENAHGYTLELRIPRHLVGERMAFAIRDGDTGNRLQSARLYPPEQLGRLVSPSKHLSAQLADMTPLGGRAWLLNHEGLVIAQHGQLDIDGPLSADQERLPWLIQRLILAVLPQRADQVFAIDADSIRLKHTAVLEALNGRPASARRRIPNQDAIVVSAAAPLRQRQGQSQGVVGAVLVEQTTNAILSIQNLALQRLFGVTLVFFVVTSLGLLLFAGRLTARIRALRDALEQAVSHDGRIVGQLKPSKAPDEIGELHRGFASVLQRLSDYNQYLEAMASRLAHELRTPLSVVRTSLENASHGELPDQQAQYIERAHQGAQRLETILQRLREATRLEQSLQTAEFEDFDLTQLLQHQTEAFRSLWPEIEWQLNCQPVPFQVHAVPDLICQALEKIVSNAVDFHQAGSAITLELSIKAQQLTLAVINHGPALPNEIDLFQSMVSARTARSEQPHLGLGLYLVRLIADFHQAEAFAENLPAGRVQIGLRLPYPHRGN